MIVGSFRQYDYGFIKNVFKYRNNKPPEYNLAAVTSPVSMIVGPNDWLATPEVSESYSHLLYSRGLQTSFECITFITHSPYLLLPLYKHEMLKE